MILIIYFEKIRLKSDYFFNVTFYEKLPTSIKLGKIFVVFPTEFIISDTTLLSCDSPTESFIEGSILINITKFLGQEDDELSCAVADGNMIVLNLLFLNYLFLQSKSPQQAHNLTETSTSTSEKSSTQHQVALPRT